MTTPIAPSPSPSSPAPRRGRAFWLWQVLPALVVVLPLLSSDSSLVQMTLAMFVLVAFVCVVSLLVRGVRLLFRRGDPARLVRPALTLVLFVAAFAYLQHSLAEARVAAGALAAEMQAACVRDGRCPAELPIPAGTNASLRWLSTPTTHLRWSLRYVPTETGFEMQLLEMMDISARWRGGPHVPLVADRVEDGFEIPLDENGEPLKSRADFD